MPAWDRLLFAIDQFESGQMALGFVASVAAANDASVRVLHIRELPGRARILPLETRDEAEDLVRDALHSLQLVGVAAEGRSVSMLHEHMVQRIVDEASLWECQAIVLGSRQLRGVARLSGHGVRERILRLSPLPVLVAPTPDVVDVTRRSPDELPRGKKAAWVVGSLVGWLLLGIVGAAVAVVYLVGPRRKMNAERWSLCHRSTGPVPARPAFPHLTSCSPSVPIGRGGSEPRPFPEREPLA